MNKPRLIDANALFKAITDGKYTTGNIFKDMELQEFIKEQPTAYDIDKVVEQLEHLGDKEEARYRTVYGDERIRIDGFVDGIQHAIEIVKGVRNEKISNNNDSRDSR